MVRNKAISITGGLAFAVLQALSAPVYSDVTEIDKRCAQDALSWLDYIRKNPKLEVNEIEVPVEDDAYGACLSRHLSRYEEGRYKIIKGLDGKHRVVEYLEKYR
ncbi:hypothetical protein J4204_06170 [Candidatus Woesearchaeota archaeon]|nr:hypothetical protein [Candidatus Woesearchaeota archaeon]